MDTDILILHLSSGTSTLELYSQLGICQRLPPFEGVSSEKVLPIYSSSISKCFILNPLSGCWKKDLWRLSIYVYWRLCLHKISKLAWDGKLLKRGKLIKGACGGPILTCDIDTHLMQMTYTRRRLFSLVASKGTVHYDRGGKQSSLVHDGRSLHGVSMTRTHTTELPRAETITLRSGPGGHQALTSRPHP